MNQYISHSIIESSTHTNLMTTRNDGKMSGLNWVHIQSANNEKSRIRMIISI